MAANGSGARTRPLDPRKTELRDDVSAEHIELRRQQSASNRLDDNFDGLIVNPLRHYTDDALRAEAETFALSEVLRPNQHNTDEGRRVLRAFRLGARIAKASNRWQVVQDELDDTEKAALSDEKTRFFRQPRAVYLTFVTCSIGALVQGWAQTTINGANLWWPTDLDLPLCEENDEESRTRYFMLFGLVNAASFLSASLIGAWLADPISNGLMLGRRGTIALSAVFCLVSILGSAFVRHWDQLLVCRLLLGVGLGLKASIVPIFAAENSPTSIRGSVVMGWQLNDALGILLAYCANLIFNTVTSEGGLNWRLQLGSAILPTIPLLILIYFCPESPRWHVKHRQFAAAYQSSCQLRNCEIQAARDLFYLTKQIEVEKRYLNERYRPHASEGGGDPKESYFLRFRELFTVGRIRRATVGSFVVMLAQQLCGINIISFFSTNLFSTSNADTITFCPPQPSRQEEQDALLYGLGTGIANFLFTLPAIKTIDIWGRRNLLLWTFPNMAWAILGTGLATLASDPTVRRGLFGLFSILFVAFYSVGEGPVPFVYSAESFPVSHREVGMGFSVTTNFFFAGILALVYWKMNDSMKVAGALGLFACFNLIAWVLIFLFVPETAETSLEDLDYIFGMKTRKHADYQNQLLKYKCTSKSKRSDPPRLYKVDEPPSDSGPDVSPQVSRPVTRGTEEVAPDEVVERDRRPSDVSISSEEGDRRERSTALNGRL